MLHERIAAKDDIQQLTWNSFQNAHAYILATVWLDSDPLMTGAYDTQFRLLRFIIPSTDITGLLFPYVLSLQAAA